MEKKDNLLFLEKNKKKWQEQKAPAILNTI
jgi:hypothetical protein